MLVVEQITGKKRSPPDPFSREAKEGEKQKNPHHFLANL